MAQKSAVLSDRLVKKVEALFKVRNRPVATPTSEEGEPTPPLDVDPADSDPRRFPEGSPMAFPDPGKPYPVEGEPYENPDASTITALSPDTVALGSPDFTLSVTGTGFVEGDTIVFNGGVEETTFVSATELTTGVDMSTAAAAIAVPVLVQSAGGAQSNALDFTFTEPVAADPESRSRNRTPKHSTREGD